MSSTNRIYLDIPIHIGTNYSDLAKRLYSTVDISNVTVNVKVENRSRLDEWKEFLKEAGCELHK